MPLTAGQELVGATLVLVEVLVLGVDELLVVDDWVVVSVDCSLEVVVLVDGDVDVPSAHIIADDGYPNTNTTANNKLVVLLNVR